jgi:hypothetical protein
LENTTEVTVDKSAFNSLSAEQDNGSDPASTINLDDKVAADTTIKNERAFASGAKEPAVVQNSLNGTALKLAEMKADQVNQRLPSAETLRVLSSRANAENSIAGLANQAAVMVGSELRAKSVLLDKSVSVAEKAGGTAKVVTDPRFADLLNRPEISLTLRQQQGVTFEVVNNFREGFVPNGADVLDGQVALGATGIKDVSLDTGTILNLSPENIGVTLGFQGDEVGMLNSADKGTANNQLHLVQHSAGISSTLGTTSTAATISLNNGSVLPESEVVQQTIEHLSVHARGDSSTVTVKLHPEELGELQLRMVMEGDKLSVHLHAQSQQVQEVLERNFPRLRDALQDMGVNVEDFQVSNGASEQGNQQAFTDQEFSGGMNRGQDTFFSGEAAEEITPVLTAATMAPSSGISVRV